MYVNNKLDLRLDRFTKLYTGTWQAGDVPEWEGRREIRLVQKIYSYVDNSPIEFLIQR